MRRSSNARLALGLHSGQFDLAQCLREIARAYRAGDVEPGMDSLIVYDADFAMGDVLVTHLLQLQACVEAQERGATLMRGYRSVLVAPHRAAHVFSSVYVAAWQQGAGRAFPLPCHEILPCLDIAAGRIGAEHLADEIADMRPPAGLRYLI